MIQMGHQLQFDCERCEGAVSFSILDADGIADIICCEHCGKKYLFDDEKLLRQLRQFELLCRQIHASEEILGCTSIAIDVGSHSVKVPYNILLTRLTSVLELSVGGKKLAISFRLEPLKDIV